MGGIKANLGKAQGGASRPATVSYLWGIGNVSVASCNNTTNIKKIRICIIGFLINYYSLQVWSKYLVSKYVLYMYCRQVV